MEFMSVALDLEEKTITFYKTLAEQCSSHAGIQRIMNMLIQDQEKHLQNLDDNEKRTIMSTRIPLERISRTVCSFGILLGCDGRGCRVASAVMTTFK